MLVEAALVECDLDSISLVQPTCGSFDASGLIRGNHLASILQPRVATPDFPGVG